MTKTVFDQFDATDSLTLELNFDFNEEEFFEFCRINRDLRIEQDENGTIHITPPTGFDTGNFNSDINADLNIWNRKTKSGKVGDSNTGYTLPNGAVRSPDASWVSNERLAKLTDEERQKFAPVCPEFVIETLSPSDSLSKLQSKMEEYIQNGSLLGWLIDRKNEQVHIYRADDSVALIESFSKKLSGDEVLPGFEVLLSDFVA